MTTHSNVSCSFSSTWIFVQDTKSDTFRVDRVGIWKHNGFDTSVFSLWILWSGLVRVDKTRIVGNVILPVLS